VAPEEFETTVRPIFKQIQKAWGGIPFDVVNDGEVTALAGAMSLNDNAVLGISMGTSLAAGYVTPEGNITSWLNELAFVPVDYRANGPVDEWSGDAGCGVQFFSQQGVARLALLANLEFPADTPFAQQLVEVQRLMSEGDERARKIYETIGVCFGYTIAHFATLYDFRNLLILGRVTSGTGGQIIIEKAEEVLTAEFPALAAKVKISTPDERMKRHGQAVAAASLPMIGE
jgi:predicted NBD/HSP70 family sugar kinase